MLTNNDIDLYRNGGSSVVELAAKYDVSRESIYRWLKISYVPTSRHVKVFLSEQQLDALANKQTSQRQLAKEMGCSKTAIGKAIKRHQYDYIK